MTHGRFCGLASLLLVVACGGGQSFDDGRDGVGRRSGSKAQDAGPSAPGSRDLDASPGDGQGSGEADAGGSEAAREGDDDSPGSGGNDDDGSSGGLDNPDAPDFSCDEVRRQQFDPRTMSPYRLPREVEETVDEMLLAMAPAEQASQMMGVNGIARDYRDIMRGPDVTVEGVGTIRGLHFRDGSRGVNLEAGQDNRTDDGKNFATVFPVASLRAASFDLELERRIGVAIGDETAASLNNVLLAPSVDVVRHPYWGRVQESYGEDPYLTGRMATAFTVGAQQYVMACAKHLIGYNGEKLRSTLNAVLSEQTLREVYGRPFEMVVQDGGVACMMATYHLVNGVKATQNRHLLRDVLKAPVGQGGMGFQGFVISELWAMPGDQQVPDLATAQAVAIEAVMAGMDVERPWSLHYTEATLGAADPALVEEAARRVLTQKVRFGSALTTDPFGAEPPSSTLNEGSITTSPDHEALAEASALASMVLLTNGLEANAAVLPLGSASSIAVVGLDQDFGLISSSAPKSCPTDGATTTRSCTFHFATDPALGDRGSSLVNGDPERTVGPFEGIRQVAGADRDVTGGNSAEAAEDADAVVVVVGYTPGDEGEEYPIAQGGDRLSLSLPPGHAELVDSVLDLGKPTVVVIESGSIVNLPWLDHPNRSQATIWAGYPGSKGGLALGKLLFGEANFSGKMPMAWPSESELPAFKDAETVTALDYHFGYREFDRRRHVDGAPVELVFPFGHGLSYSSFAYSNLSVPCEEVSDEAVFEVSVDVTNTSTIDGDEIVMLFVKPPPRPDGIQGERPWKDLRSFARVHVPAESRVTVTLPLRVRDLRRWEGGEDGAWVVDGGEYTLLVGKNAEDAETSGLAGVVTVVGD